MVLGYLAVCVLCVLRHQPTQKWQALPSHRKPAEGPCSPWGCRPRRAVAARRTATHPRSSSSLRSSPQKKKKKRRKKKTATTAGLFSRDARHLESTPTTSSDSWPVRPYKVGLSAHRRESESTALAPPVRQCARGGKREAACFGIRSPRLPKTNPAQTGWSPPSQLLYSLGSWASAVDSWFWVMRGRPRGSEGRPGFLRFF